MEYTKEEIHKTVEKQRAFFKTGKTLDIGFRLSQLKKLRLAIIRNEEKLEDSISMDLGRSKTEGYVFDIGTVLYQIREIMHGLKKWAKPEKHFSGLLNFPSLITKVYKMPYGVCLIITPFNLPYVLAFGQLIASIAGGNTTVIKPSSRTPHCTELLKKIISETFEEDYVSVVTGSHDVSDMCLEERFDKIFYTGSPKVAGHILEKAAKNIIPVALELGGETGNWAIVRKDADLKDAARKIAFFTILNSGQVCIRINQVAVASEVADEFIKYLKHELDRQIPNALNNREYPRLITESAYQRCKTDCEKYKNRIVYGGCGNGETLKFQPTVLYPIDIDEDIVQRELFNPLFSVVKYNDSEIDRLLNKISDREHGLALYLFTKNIRWANKVMSTTQYGGGCINEVGIQFLVNGVPFNGTGHSGMGAYHGEWGFREFTHPSTVLRGFTRFNLSVREHPYTERKLKLFKLLLR